MEIEYRKAYIRRNLILGLLWLIIFMLAIFSNGEPSLLDFLWLLFSAYFCGVFIYQRVYKYIVIKDGIISIGGPLGKKVHLNDLKQVTKRMRRLEVAAGERKLTINTEMIESGAINDLLGELEKWSMAQMPGS